MKRASLLFAFIAIAVLLIAGTMLWTKGDSAAAAAAIREKCETGGFECVARGVTRFAEERGLSSAFLALREIYTSPVAHSTQCGDVAYLVGESYYKTHPDYASVSLPPEAVFCNYAFIQAYSLSMASTTGDARLVQGYCEYVKRELGSVAAGAELECYRGLGYGTLFSEFAKTKSIPIAISRGISACESVSGDEEVRKTCAAGVFNKAAMAILSHRDGATSDPKDPLGICTRQEESYRETCYGNFKYVLVREVDPIPHTVDAIAALEHKYSAAPDLEPSLEAVAWTRAYESTIRMMPSPDIASAVAECGSLRAALRRQCLLGVGMSLAKNAPQGEREFIPRFCTVVHDTLGDVGTSCPGTEPLRYLKNLYPRADFEKLCSKLNEIQDGWCDHPTL